MNHAIYRIVLNCWYQENGGTHQKELIQKEFNEFEDVLDYLREESDKMLDSYPIESIEIVRTNIEI